MGTRRGQKEKRTVVREREESDMRRQRERWTSVK